ASWNRLSRARVLSASLESASAVEPTRSAKRTVASFRSSICSDASEIGLPQLGQKRAAAGADRPQFAQNATLRLFLAFRHSRSAARNGLPRHNARRSRTARFSGRNL